MKGSSWNSIFLLFTCAAQKGFCLDHEISITAKIQILWAEVGSLVFRDIQMNHFYVESFWKYQWEIISAYLHLSLAVVYCTAIYQVYHDYWSSVVEEGGLKYIKCFSSSFKKSFWCQWMLQDEWNCRQLLPVFLYLYFKKMLEVYWWWRHLAFDLVINLFFKITNDHLYVLWPLFF